jgi:nucleotide-binding universal stress UspA family protein
MISIQRILCPVDFSDFSRRAVDHAVAVARWYESTVTLFHVCAAVPVAAYAPGAPLLPSAMLTPADRDELMGALRSLAETEAGTTVPIELEIAEGNAATEILARAETMSSDLLVMGTHGRSGFERLVLGSVTEKVLRRALCPVLTVPRDVPDAVPAPPALFRRILCAVDFSDCSMRALNYAMSLAQEADAQLAVLHVIEVPPEVPPDVHETILTGPRSLREYVAAAEEERRARLHDAVPEAVRAFCTVETILTSGKPYREILRVASERGSGLIVIGIQGRGALERLFFGSTAQHVVRQAACPVLTIRSESQ